MWRSMLLVPMLLGGCICPFDASRCLHPPDPDRFVREYGHCKQPGSLAALRSDPSEARGSLPKAEVNEVLCKTLWKAKWCYESAMAAFYPPPNRVPEGRVEVMIVIGSEGRVDEAVLARDDVRSPSLACCLVQTAKELRFPKPDGDGSVVVSYPFMFLRDTTQNQRLYPEALRHPCLP